MNIYWQLFVIVSVFSAGAYTDHKFSLADKVTSAYAAVTKAQNGEMEIIKDNQALENNHEKHKDPCDNAIVPSDDDRVLH